MISEPVPAVVGTAYIGRELLSGLSAVRNEDIFLRLTDGFVTLSPTAFAESRIAPPPIAIIPSQLFVIQRFTIFSTVS